MSQADLQKLLEEVLKPLVAADGGTLEMVEASDDLVVLRMSGACAGCPGAPYTTARVIEPAIRRTVGHAIEIRYERVASPSAAPPEK